MNTPIVFSENKLVNSAAHKRVEIMFGKEWVKKTDCVTKNTDGYERHEVSQGEWKMIVASGNVYFAPSFCIETRKNNKEHDPAFGVPAIVRFRNNGVVSRIVHYQNGERQNPAEDVPAETGYWPSGAVEYQKFYVNGRLTDMSDGWPANVFYKENGTVEKAESALLGTVPFPRIEKMIDRIKLKKLQNLCSDDEAIVALGGKMGGADILKGENKAVI